MRRALPELLRSRGQGAPSLEAGQDGRGSAAAAAAAAAVPAGEAAAAAAADSRSEDALLRALQAQLLQQP